MVSYEKLGISAPASPRGRAYGALHGGHCELKLLGAGDIVI